MASPALLARNYVRRLAFSQLYSSQNSQAPGVLDLWRVFRGTAVVYTAVLAYLYLLQVASLSCPVLPPTQRCTPAAGTPPAL